MPTDTGTLLTRRWAALSIRARLSMIYATALGVMLVIYAVFVYTTVREQIGRASCRERVLKDV